MAAVLYDEREVVIQCTLNKLKRAVGAGWVKAGIVPEHIVLAEEFTDYFF